jgi:hypothetical protein
MKRISLGFVLAIGGAFVVPTAASAATTLGETFTPGLCTPDTTYIQTVDPGNRYVVPFDGVITRWAYQAPTSGSNPTTVKLAIGSVASGADLSHDAQITIVGESAGQGPVASTLNAYLTQISVKAGDRIGEYVNGPGPNVGCSRSDDAYTDHYFGPPAPSPGSTELFTMENFQQDVSAVLEKDCDHDGLGDETQDTDLSACATGKRAAAIKRCKKKHRGKAHAKKRRKCIKHARKLPV